MRWINVSGISAAVAAVAEQQQQYKLELVQQRTLRKAAAAVPVAQPGRLAVKPNGQAQNVDSTGSGWSANHLPYFFQKIIISTSSQVFYWLAT